jgi:ATP-dependent exoDNAse (exonuclease V) beta subunit
VFVLEYDKLPFAWKNITDEQYRQENNLLLVALTRSKEYMALVQSPRKEGEDEW